MRLRDFLCSAENMPSKLSQSPVVAVLNMKGGVGKTTISGNLFRELYRRLRDGSKTLLIDFDAQFNLSQLVLTEFKYSILSKQRKTIWHVLEPDVPSSIFSICESDLVKIQSVAEYVTCIKKTTKDHELFLLPGDFRISALNLRESMQSLEFPRRRFSNLIKNAREEFTLTVLDCNPSSSFLTRCAIENATHVLVPVRPDKYSILGLKMLDDYIGSLPGLSRRPELIVVMNGVTREQSSVEAEIRGHPNYGKRVLLTRIPHTKILAARADYTGFGADRGVRNSRITRSVLIRASDELIKVLGVI